MALGDIRYLLDSEHRITVLELLLEAPQTQTDPRERAEASTATVSRQVRSFDDRGWVRRRNGSYELTPVGRFVATEFIGLHERLVAVEDLHDIVGLLPRGRGSGARLSRRRESNVPDVREPDGGNRANDGTRATRFRVRALSNELLTMCMGGHLATLGEGTQTLESVFNREIYETIASSSPEGRQKILKVSGTGRATLYVYEADVPHVLGIMDDIVYIGIENETGAPVALVETSDAGVFGWAVETFESSLEEATLMTRDSFRQLRTTGS